VHLTNNLGMLIGEAAAAAPGSPDRIWFLHPILLFGMMVATIDVVAAHPPGFSRRIREIKADEIP
jgi:hypothetical protein